MQFNPLNLKAFYFFTGKPIIWNGEEDELLCSEIFAVDLLSPKGVLSQEPGAKSVAENP